MITQTVSQLYQNPPKADTAAFTVSGWVRTVRDSKAFGFMEINDGTSFKNLQIVLEGGKTEGFAEALKITLGSAIRATGTLTLTPGMKQPFELKADTVETVGLCDPSYPLQKKRHSFEYLRTIRTSGPARTRITRCFASARWRRRSCTSSLWSAGLCTCIRPSSPQATAKARARCSRSRRWI